MTVALTSLQVLDGMAKTNGMFKTSNHGQSWQPKTVYSGMQSVFKKGGRGWPVLLIGFDCELLLN
jgi:hypothetical protein